MTQPHRFTEDQAVDSLLRDAAVLVQKGWTRKVDARDKNGNEVYYWNDAKERTKEQVVETLRKAADKQIAIQAFAEKCESAVWRTVKTMSDRESEPCGLCAMRAFKKVRLRGVPWQWGEGIMALCADCEKKMKRAYKQTHPALVRLFK